MVLRVLRVSSSLGQRQLLLSWNGATRSKYVERYGVQGCTPGCRRKLHVPFFLRSLPSLLLPGTRGGASPLPYRLWHAPAYLCLLFPRSPPDSRRSKREVVRGLLRPPSFHTGTGRFLCRQPQSIPRLGALAWSTQRTREVSAWAAWCLGPPAPLRCVAETTEDGAS